MKPDWQMLLFGEGGAVIRTLEALSSKRFPGDTALADTAFNHVLDVLTSDDYAKLRRFRGDASPKTFLISCFRNALEDFARAKFGKCLPPGWLKGLGPAYVTAYRRLCCERQATRNVVDSLRAMASLDEPEVRGIVARVLERVPSCGEHGTKPPKHVELDDAAELAVGTQAAPGDTADDELLAAVWAFVLPDGEAELDAAILARLRELRRDVLPGLELSETQKALIRFVVASGQPLSEAAVVVGLNYHAARRQLQAGLARLKQAFDDGGLTPEHFE